MAARPIGIWSGDRGLSLLLLFLVGTIFVVVPMMEMGLAGNLTLTAVFSLILATGITVVPRRWVLPTATLVAFAVLERWTNLLVPSLQLQALDALSSVIACGALAAIVTMQVFRAGPINGRRIQGAIAVYLLLGLAWGSAYELVEIVRPGVSFSSTDLPGGGERFHFIYFSFIVLTTVGFGDVTPIDPVARSLASLEALVGQLYPAILLARLVSMELLTKE